MRLPETEEQPSIRETSTCELKSDHGVYARKHLHSHCCLSDLAKHPVVPEVTSYEP